MNLEPEIPYYLWKLRAELSLRQRKNAAYSIRAFAKSLSLHPGTLSNVLNGSRGLPISQAQKVVEKLALSPLEASRFKESIQNSKKSIQKLFETVRLQKEEILNEECHYHVISEWEHFAVLSLMKTEDFKNDSKWVGKRLGISTQRAQQALSNLLAVGLIVKNSKGELERSSSKFSTTTDVSSSALVKSHLEHLALAEKKLGGVPVEFRGYYSETLAIDPKNLPVAKALIFEFQKKLGELLEKDEKTEVYQIGIQMFPLTNVKENEERNVK